jgi:hypothetical protein
LFQEIILQVSETLVRRMLFEVFPRFFLLTGFALKVYIRAFVHQMVFHLLEVHLISLTLRNGTVVLLE